MTKVRKELDSCLNIELELDTSHIEFEAEFKFKTQGSPYMFFGSEESQLGLESPSLRRGSSASAMNSAFTLLTPRSDKNRLSKVDCYGSAVVIRLIGL